MQFNLSMLNFSGLKIYYRCCLFVQYLMFKINIVFPLIMKLKWIIKQVRLFVTKLYTVINISNYTKYFSVSQKFFYNKTI